MPNKMFVVILLLMVLSMGTMLAQPAIPTYTYTTQVVYDNRSEVLQGQSGVGTIVVSALYSTAVPAKELRLERYSSYDCGQPQWCGRWNTIETVMVNFDSPPQSGNVMAKKIVKPFDFLQPGQYRVTDGIRSATAVVGNPFKSSVARQTGSNIRAARIVGENLVLEVATPHPTMILVHSNVGTKAEWIYKSTLEFGLGPVAVVTVPTMDLASTIQVTVNDLTTGNSQTKFVSTLDEYGEQK